MRRILAPAALAGVLALAAGCSDGGTDPESSGLTREEAAELAVHIGATSSDAIDMPATASRVPGPAASASAAGPWSFDNDVSLSLPCPLGGRVAIDGEIVAEGDTDDNSGALDVEAVVTHEACEVRARGQQFTLDGDPNLTLGAEFAWDRDGQASPLRVTQVGGFHWARGSGASGDCTVNLVAVTDLEARRRTVEGTFCGFDIHEELTWGPQG